MTRNEIMRGYKGDFATIAQAFPNNLFMGVGMAFFYDSKAIKFLTGI